LKGRLHALVDAVVERAEGDGPSPERERLASSARELLARKLAMSGTKSETRVHLEALLSKRLGEVFDGLDHDAEGVEPLATEVLLGTLLSGQLLAEFADAVDRVILECGSPRDYSFAGRADFISLEEVLQLLGGAKHRGRLSLEKPDNRLDIYLDNSAVAFLDPHRFIRRVLPIPDRMTYREISLELLEKAEQRHAQEGVPIFMTLEAEGFLRKGEAREVMRQLGSEVLFDFLREQEDVAYTYRRLDELPSFAVQHNLKVAVTPLLLEGNKQRDDWRGLHRVFPDPNQPLQPVPNIFTRIGSMDLGVLEIKMLAQINNKATPRALVSAMGLPLHEIYHYLVRFAKDGILVPPGGKEPLGELAMTIEESVEIAWQALDANDDDIAVSSALDKVLGGFGETDTGQLGSRRLKTVEESDDEDP
jgi:hypothetical protein